MAHLSGDANLLKAFANGEDIHRATAAEIFGVTTDVVTSEQRRYAKVINFGLIYGMSAFGLAGNLGIERSAAQNYIDRYFQRYPGVAQYMADTRTKSQSTWFCRNRVRPPFVAAGNQWREWSASSGCGTGGD
jgi:DNA polymerase-1